jgi:hypothetical protein
MTVNLATVLPSANNFSALFEPNAPQQPSGVKNSTTTTPSISKGIVDGTIIAKMNNQLVHVCDFSNEMKKNNALKRFLIAEFAEIQKAIRAVLRALGASDPSGTFSATAAWLRGLANEILDFKRRILDPILDFTKEVAGFVIWAQAMINYIKSLPARLYAVLESCLLKILNLVANILTDAFDTIDNPFTDVAQAAKQVAAAATSTLGEVATIAVTAKAVQVQAFGSSTSSSLNSTAATNAGAVSPSLALVSQPITPSTQSAANAAATLLVSTVPTSANVAAQNTQSNADKKSTP